MSATTVTVSLGSIRAITPLSGHPTVAIVLRFAAMEVLVDSGCDERVEALHRGSQVGFVDAALARQLRNACCGLEESALGDPPGRYARGISRERALLAVAGFEDQPHGLAAAPDDFARS